MGALRSVFPGAREQRCWVRETASVLDALPKRLQPRAKSLLHEMDRFVSAIARADSPGDTATSGMAIRGAGLTDYRPKVRGGLALPVTATISS